MYGRVTAAVVAAGRKPRGRIADLMIAAAAISEDLRLYTTNPGDYAGLENSSASSLSPAQRCPTRRNPTRGSRRTAWGGVAGR
jgi:hypothetical protein